jgi:twitching motility protein PilT
MQTLEKALADLVLNRQVSLEEAVRKTARPEELRRMVSQVQ